MAKSTGVPRCLVLVLAGGLAAAVTPPAAASQATTCDPDLLRLAPRVNGYRNRGDRCEGVYIKQVGGTSIFLASLTETFDDYDLQAVDSLEVQWALPTPGAALELRAETIRRGRYYRMESARPVGANAYRWPTTILSAEKIPRRDLGIIGRIRPEAGRGDPIYVPLRVYRRQTLPRCGSYDLVFWPGERLSEVFLSVTPLDQYSAGKPVMDAVPLAQGFYPAESPIRVSLKQGDLGPAGLYRLRVAARLASGGTSTRDYTVFFSSSGCPR